MATEWELIHFCLLPPQIKDADLGIRDTSAKTRFGVRLVLTIPVTAGGYGNKFAGVHTQSRPIDTPSHTLKIRPKAGWERGIEMRWPEVKTARTH